MTARLYISFHEGLNGGTWQNVFGRLIGATFLPITGDLTVTLDRINVPASSDGFSGLDSTVVVLRAAEADALVQIGDAGAQRYVPAGETHVEVMAAGGKIAVIAAPATSSGDVSLSAATLSALESVSLNSDAIAALIARPSQGVNRASVRVPLTNQGSSQLAYTVPNGKTFYLTDVVASFVSGAMTGVLNFRDGLTVAGAVRLPTMIALNQSGRLSHTFLEPLIFTSGVFVENTMVGYSLAFTGYTE